MITPPDLTHLRFRLGLWTRKTSNQWTDEAFRKTVVDFLDGYVESRNKVSGWEVDEHFTGMQGRAVDINRRKRDASGQLTRGKNNLAYPAGVNQSNNKPVLVLKVIRPQGTEVEVGFTYEDGLQTDAATLSASLNAAAQLWDLTP